MLESEVLCKPCNRALREVEVLSTQRDSLIDHKEGNAHLAIEYRVALEYCQASRRRWRVAALCGWLALVAAIVIRWAH